MSALKQKIAVAIYGLMHRLELDLNGPGLTMPSTLCEHNDRIDDAKGDGPLMNIHTHTSMLLRYIIYKYIVTYRKDTLYIGSRHRQTVVYFNEFCVRVEGSHSNFVMVLSPFI